MTKALDKQLEERGATEAYLCNQPIILAKLDNDKTAMIVPPGSEILNSRKQETVILNDEEVIGALDLQTKSEHQRKPWEPWAIRLRA